MPWKDGECRKGGRTVLFVSHNMSAIENLCNTVLMLMDGCLVDAGSPSRLIKRYVAETSTYANVSPPSVQIERVRPEFESSPSRFSMAGATNPESNIGTACYFSRALCLCRASRFRNCRVILTVQKDDRPYIMMSTEVIPSPNYVRGQWLSRLCGVNLP